MYLGNNLKIESFQGDEIIKDAEGSSKEDFFVL